MNANIKDAKTIAERNKVRVYGAITSVFTGRYEKDIVIKGQKILAQILKLALGSQFVICPET